MATSTNCVPTESMGAQAFAKDLGGAVPIRLRIHSSAALSKMSRTGLGEAHIEISHWAMRSRTLLTETNSSDLGTMVRLVSCAAHVYAVLGGGSSHAMLGQELKLSVVWVPLCSSVDCQRRARWLRLSESERNPCVFRTTCRSSRPAAGRKATQWILGASDARACSGVPPFAVTARSRNRPTRERGGRRK